MPVAADALRALVFDVFGTCTDWRGSIIRAGQRVRPDADWPRIADLWRRQGYIEAIARIRAGQMPYATSDVLFRRKLEELNDQYALQLSPTEVDDLALAWRRLDPWPDVVEGLQRLKRRYLIAPLSNGTFATLTEMAKRAGLPWDCIISTELRNTFKPERAAYLLAPTLLDVQPEQVMLVAAHANDLRGAQAAGLHTAHVLRHQEWGPGGPPPEPSDPSFDYVAADFLDLDRQLSQ
jgi:2-haloacid dehalogenase